jgi:tRNA G10  N-methylase Trm11
MRMKCPGGGQTNPYRATKLYYSTICSQHGLSLPFLVPPESIESESLILVLAFGTPSLLEAQCVFGNSAQVSMQCEDIAVADLKGGRFKWPGELAGVHKVALPLPPIDSPEFTEAITFPERNFNFSLSLYCPRDDPEVEYDELSERLLSTVREAGHRKANLIRSRSGPELHSERVVSRSAMDFVVFPIGATSQWGITVYIPETEGFKERSKERPYVTSGISLSSRLARMLVNISGVSKGQVLLDPFCGSGTVLGEALLKGADCIGVDRNHGSVERTKENLAWFLSQSRRSGQRVPSYSVITGDATNLTRSLGDQTVDAIVSEPILIPRLSSPPSLEKARHLVKRASIIYSEALHEMSGLLRRGGRMVLVTPSLRTIEGKDVALSFDDLKEIGLKPFQPPGAHYEYPLKVSHQSTRWVRRMVHALERV